MPGQTHPGLKVSGHQPPANPAPEMSPEDLEYRMLLQEAILWVTIQILVEQREEITRRAVERLRTLAELRGE